jgi:transcriptional regulator NrdR family protein
MNDAINYLLEKAMELNIKIVKDTGWSDPVSGGRCIKDFYREVAFGREVSSDELNQIKKIMAEKHCPGWTGVSSKNIVDNVFKFSTTYDSSD